MFSFLAGRRDEQAKDITVSTITSRLIGSRVEFKNTWKAYVEAIGQTCKSLRKPRK